MFAAPPPSFLVLGANQVEQAMKTSGAWCRVADLGPWLYLAGEDGQLLVLRAGRAFEVLNRIEMGETIFATPAISSGTLYVRTRGHLYPISATGQAAADR